MQGRSFTGRSQGPSSGNAQIAVSTADLGKTSYQSDGTLKGCVRF